MEKRQNLLFKIAGAMFVLIFLDYASTVKNYLEAYYYDDFWLRIVYVIGYVLITISVLIIIFLLFKRVKGKLLGAAFILYTILPIVASFVLRCIFPETSFSFLDIITFNNFLMLAFSLVVMFEDKLGRFKERVIYLMAYLFVFKDIYYCVKRLVQIYINPNNYSRYGYYLETRSVDIEMLNMMRTLFMGFILSTACISVLAVILNKSADEKSIRIHKIGLVGIPVLAVVTVLNIIESMIFLLVVEFIEFEIGLIFTVAFSLNTFILLISFILLPLALLNPGKGIAAEAKDILNSGKNGSSNVITAESGYINIGVHIVLYLFTFGIWNLIWVCRTTAYLNRTPNSEQYNPLSKLLLFMFVPFYSIYWYYRHGQRADALSRSQNINSSDISTLCLVMAIFIPIVACIILQDRINNISRPKSTAASASYPTHASSFPAEQHSDEKNLENLKLLKELLDAGAITQEEYDAKKSKFLNL